MTKNSDEVDFDWNDKETVIQQVDAVAVYINTKGNVVIRQAHGMGKDDSIIVIPPSTVQELIFALQRQAGLSDL